MAVPLVHSSEGVTTSIFHIGAIELGWAQMSHLFRKWVYPTNIMNTPLKSPQFIVGRMGDLDRWEGMVFIGHKSSCSTFVAKRLSTSTFRANKSVERVLTGGESAIYKLFGFGQR